MKTLLNNRILWHPNKWIPDKIWFWAVVNSICCWDTIIQYCIYFVSSRLILCGVQRGSTQTRHFQSKWKFWPYTNTKLSLKFMAKKYLMSFFFTNKTKAPQFKGSDVNLFEDLKLLQKSSSKCPRHAHLIRSNRQALQMQRKLGWSMKCHYWLMWPTISPGS